MGQGWGTSDSLPLKHSLPCSQPSTLCAVAPRHLVVGWVIGSKAFLHGDDTGRHMESARSAQIRHTCALHPPVY